jgi:ATP-binding cassette subfamily C protein CydD
LPTVLSRRLLRLLAPARRRLAGAVVVGLGITATYVLQGLLVAEVIDRILVGSDLGRLAGSLAGVFVLLVFRAVLLRSRETIGSGAASVVKAGLRRRLYAQLLALGPAYGLKQRTGESVSTLVDGVEALDPYAALWVPQLVTSVVGASAIVVVIAWIAPVVGAVVAVCSLGVAFLPRLVRRALVRRHVNYWTGLRALGAEYLDAIQGMTTLKAMGVSESHGDGLARRSRDFYRASIRLTAISNLSAGTIGFVASAGTALSVGVGAALTASGHLSVFRLLVVLMLSREAFRPLIDLQNAYHSAFGVPPAAAAVFDVLDAVPAVRDPSVADDALVMARPPAVEFDDVVFSYRPGGRRALDGFTVSAAAGETLAIVGTSGAGKTTAVSLLLRFFDVDSGHVRIGGVDVTDLPLGLLRSSISVVSQDTYLFHGSVAENIALGRIGATREEVEAAAMAANAHAFIAALPAGYDTVIGERGLKLSGGERQRLAIARAVLKDAPLLVLDEATSAIDVAGERTVQEALERLSQGRTTVVIAHRLSAIRRADRIVTLEGGRAIEVGDHDSLIATGGAYARLVGMQGRSS